MFRKLFCLASFAAVLFAARYDISTSSKVVRVADPQIAPDGKSILISVSRANFTTNRWESHLILVDTATKAQHDLAPGLRGPTVARWSPDGSSIAFLASVDGKPQIFVTTPAGSPRQITKSPTGVQHFSWRPDGKAFAFGAVEEDPKKEGEEKFNKSFEVKFNDYLRQDAPKSSHLWLAVIDGETRRLTSGSWTGPIAYPPGPPPFPVSWSPDGTSIALVKIASPYSGDFDQAAIQILDVESGKMRALTNHGRGESHPEFSPDGRHIAYWYPRDSKPRNENEIFLAPVTGGEGRSLTHALDRHALRGMWLPDGKSLLVAANDRTTTGVWHQPVDGPAKRITFGGLVAAGSYGLDATVSKDGHVALVASEPERPAELYALTSLDAKPERITDFNADIASLELGKTETIEWQGPDGFKENGVVTFPPGFQAGRKYPLVLYIHGGPAGTSKQAFSGRAQLFAAQDWIVFEPNYRGSDNGGNTFKKAIDNDAGAGPGRDVISGIEALKKRGFVDDSRMAVSGWSYGGYMTSWMIGNYPGMWKAAVAGAAVTDWFDQYNLGDANVRRGSAFGGSPYTDAKRMEAYRVQSPITHDVKARTPTLILALTGDYRVPITQSYRLYHVLRDNGVPTQFIAYPLPGHNAADPVHQRDIERRWLEWLKTYLSPAGDRSGAAR
ncbi:MAG: S9 family peptidase [Bryobacteraceae bacterium]